MWKQNKDTARPTFSFSTTGEQNRFFKTGNAGSSPRETFKWAPKNGKQKTPIFVRNLFYIYFRWEIRSKICRRIENGVLKNGKQKRLFFQIFVLHQGTWLS